MKSRGLLLEFEQILALLDPFRPTHHTVHVLIL
jgi:hypothetical protein